MPPPGYYPPPGYQPPQAGPASAPYPQAPYAPPPSAPVVAAQPAPPVVDTPRPYSLGASLSTSIQSETNSTSVVTSPLVEGIYTVHPRILLGLALGFGWLLDNQGLGESTFRAGNPQLSGTYHDTWGPWRYHGGLGVTAPLAHFPPGPDGRLYESIYNRTLASGGMWNQWLWSPDRMAVPLRLGASHAFAGGEVVVAELDAALVFGATHGASGTDVLGQAALEAQLPLGSIFTLCPRLQTVLLPQASFDRWQSAAGLRGVFATKAGRYFAGLLLNLDEPLGALGGGARWGFHLGKELDL